MKKQAKESKNLLARWFFIVLGFLFLVLGCIGIVIPVLPTVPFFLLTSYCFVRGSEKFNKWFLASKLYKKYLEGFITLKSMSLFSEMLLMIFVSALLILSMVLVNKIAMTVVICILILLKYLYFIFKIKVVSKKELIEMKMKKNSLTK